MRRGALSVQIVIATKCERSSAKRAAPVGLQDQTTHQLVRDGFTPPLAAATTATAVAAAGPWRFCGIATT